MLTKRSQIVCLVLLLGLSALLDAFVALRMSATPDEARHVQYGALVLQLRPDRLNAGRYDSQMPVSALNAVPGVVASYLERRHLFPRLSAFLSRFRAARFPTLSDDKTIAKTGTWICGDSRCGIPRPKLGFECGGTWQDPPTYAVVARDRRTIHFPLRRVAHSQSGQVRG